MSELSGPALPPGYGAQTDLERDLIGPLPPPETSESPQGTGSGSFGPQLPPSRDQDPQPSVRPSYGPALPPGLGLDAPSGPAPPLEFADSTKDDEDDDPDDLIGPVPLPSGVTVTSDFSRKCAEVESRSVAMREKLVNKDKPDSAPQREEWMTELPPEIKPSGLGPRKFRTRTFDPGDRSVWTDTPADRERRAREGREREAGRHTSTEKKKTKGNPASEGNPASTRDRETAETIEEYNKKHRSESLMEIHRKRKAAEGGTGKGERIPFNRETDLELPQNLVTPAKRQALMKDSARSLRSKFTHGQHTYL